jgi:peptidoglycan/LPS O-acetylase OafA/YrhL
MSRLADPADFHLNEEGIGLLELEVEKTPAEFDRFDRRYTRLPLLGMMAQGVSQLFESLGSMTTGEFWRSVLHFMIPSFMQGPEARAKIRPAKLYPTSYLDGMRGVAAFFVYLCHCAFQVYNVWVSYGRRNTYNFMQLPWIRLIYDGRGAVSLFFVISGYALSYRLLQLCRAGKFEEFGKSLGSLTFRRAIRLYLPIWVSTFIIFVLLRLRAFEATRAFDQDKRYMPFVQESHAEYLPTTSAQFKAWLLALWRLIHVFGWDQESATQKFDFHLWTIPIEFRCSLYIFLAILATARLQPRWRLSVVGFCCYWSHQHVRWDLLLFLLGMGIAEIDQIQGIHSGKPTQISKLHFWFWLATAMAGLYLIGQPGGIHETPGWVWLSRHTPNWGGEGHRYWKTWGCAMLVLAVGRLPSWRRFFDSFTIQYLGKISYSLYLVHGPAMHAGTFHLQKLAYTITGVEGNRINYGFVLGHLMATPVIIWLADMFWRGVDNPSVKFAKWMEEKLLQKHEQKAVA